MHRMLVVVFDDETKAYEGKKALMDLDAEGSIDVCADAVVAKNNDGTMAVKEAHDYDGPIGTLLGTTIGSLIGLFVGPVGLAIGLAVGGLAGAAVDLNKAHVGRDFVKDVNKVLTPNNFALVAQIEENSTTPVDTYMEAIGGTVFRCSLSDLKHTLHEEHIAARKSRSGADESSQGSGPCQSEGKAAGKDQQTRFQDPGPTAECQRET